MVLRALFGPSQNEIWQRFAAQVGGSFTEGGFFTDAVLRVHVLDWTVTMDTFRRGTRKNERTYTRIRAPFVNADGFRFGIWNESFFSPVGRFFGMQDIEVGGNLFDSSFVIQGNNPTKVAELFECERVRGLCALFADRLHLEVQDDDGFFGATFPEGVDQLYFETYGTIRDVNALHDVYDLFAACLNRLCEIGAAYDEPPGLVH